MSGTRYLSLLGLAFGDCGKGLFTDYLTRATQAHSVVRFNGGAQAGHNVVLPGGRQHTFAQFGAGSFVADTVTVLAQPVVVHPSALLFEARALAAAGVNDAWPRLMIDARCRITTPFHQAAGRLRERLRGAQAHGTCGVGVGETVAFALNHPRAALRYGELQHPGRARDKLHHIRETLQRELAPPWAHADAGDTTAAAEWAMLCDADIAERWLQQIAPVVQRVAAQSRDAIAHRLASPGTVIFEGAQGVLLDQWRGFHPHTSWSSISTAAVEDVLADAGVSAAVEHYGVLRSYLTRHGAGPLPTHDAALDQLAEPHNSAAGWQGAFRRGHADALLLRYAVASAGRLNGLAISHLDVFDRGARLRWCQAYQLHGQAARVVHRLQPAAAHDLAYQSALTAQLFAAKPVYEANAIREAPALVARIADTAGVPVCFASYGNTHRHVLAQGKTAVVNQL